MVPGSNPGSMGRFFFRCSQNEWNYYLTSFYRFLFWVGHVLVCCFSSASAPGNPRAGLDLNLVLNCVLEEHAGEAANSTNWQWFAGRLILLEQLLAAFQQEFTAG